MRYACEPKLVCSKNFHLLLVVDKQAFVSLGRPFCSCWVGQIFLREQASACPLASLRCKEIHSFLTIPQQTHQDAWCTNPVSAVPYPTSPCFDLAHSAFCSHEAWLVGVCPSQRLEARKFINHCQPIPQLLSPHCTSTSWVFSSAGVESAAAHCRRSLGLRWCSEQVLIDFLRLLWLDS